MKSYVIAGVDFSLTSPGMSAIRVYENEQMEVLDMHSTKTKSDEDWYVRLNRIQTEILRFIFKHKPKRIYIENYSFGSTNGRETAGEVHGVVLYKLIEAGFPTSRIYRTVAPQALKKFITGKGNATKKEVVEAVNKQFGLSLKQKDNDMADAIVLAYIGYCMNHYRFIEPSLTEEQKEVIAKIQDSKPIGGN